MPEQPSPEYKALQRQLNRAHRRIEEQEKINRRMEQDSIGILTVLSGALPDASPKIQEYLSERRKQEEFDTASANAYRRLADWLSDLDIDDAQVGEIEDMVASADASNYEERFDAAFRRAQDARAEAVRGTPPDEEFDTEGDTTRTYTHEEVQRLLEGRERERGRVDTGSSSVNGAQGITPRSIDQLMDSNASHADLQATLDKALSQMSS